MEKKVKRLVNKKVLPVVIFLGACLVASLLMATKPELELQQPTALLPAVMVQTAVLKSETLKVSSEGVLKPRIESTLVPEVDGRVSWVSDALVSGGHFAEGDALLRIEVEDYQAVADVAEAMLQQASVEQSFAGDEYNRNSKLHRQKLVSQTKYDDSKRRYNLTRAEKVRAQSAFSRAQRDVERTVLKAAYTGRVRSESIAVGQFVRRGEVVAELYSIDSFEVRLPIASDQLHYLTLPAGGSDLQVEVKISADYAGSKKTWPAVLVRTEAELDARSRMVFGVAKIAQPEGEVLPVGLFVQASIEGKVVENVVRLPRVAVRDDGHILVVDAEDRIHMRRVKLLRTEYDHVLVEEGLSEGERVCISALNVVVEGMKVKPVEQEERPEL